MDILYVSEIQNLSQNTFISASIGRLKEAGYRARSRNYNDFSISEISDSEQTFTYIFYKNFFLASFTPYLVEDAIRTINDGDLESFETLHKTSDGNLHINFEELSNLLGAFSQTSPNLPASSGSYSLLADSSFVTISGFSEAGDSWLNTHTTTPSGFEMAEVIPSNASLVFHLSFSDASEWKDKQLEFLTTQQQPKRLADSLKEAFDFDPAQIFNLIDNEVGMVHLESGRPDDSRKLFILKVKESAASMDFFQNLTERIAYARGDSVYSESYSENEIRFLPIPEFPSTIIGNMAGDFERCFYLNYRNYVVFSNNLQELRDLITSTQSENTWGKSVELNDFLNQTNAQANVSLFVNVPRYWSTLDTYLKPDWSTQLNADGQHYRRFELAAFQFSNADGKYFTNFTFNQPLQKVSNQPKTASDNSITFAGQLISKPYLVRTHSHNFFDYMVQDSSNTVYYLDRRFSTLWSKNLNEAIVSDVFPIDYYRNNKLQYVFATATSIHIIDRTGTYIPGYPKSINNSTAISHFGLIDYDRSRNYRFGITDRDGKVFLTDKDLKLLEGWDPIPYNRPATSPLQHARLGNRDVMISVQENGIINVTNRRGIKQNGFPFDLRAGVDGDYYLSASNTLGRSALSVITQQGELIEINLEGIVINRDQLIKSSTETSFRLVKDRGSRSFIIIKKEGSRYEVLDATGNFLFQKDYLSNDPVLIQYYQFGAGKDLIAFTDTANNSLYVFDKSGTLITGNPIRSSNEVSILYSSSRKKLQVYTTVGANLEYYEFDY